MNEKSLCSTSSQMFDVVKRFIMQFVTWITTWLRLEGIRESQTAMVNQLVSLEMNQLQSIESRCVEEGDWRGAGSSMKNRYLPREETRKREWTRVPAFIVAYGPSLTSTWLFKDFIQLSFGNHILFNAFSVIQMQFTFACVNNFYCQVSAIATVSVIKLIIRF